MCDEEKDFQGLPLKLTRTLNVKSNKFKPPKGIETTRCEFCRSPMSWDRNVGMYFCTACRYSKSRLNNRIVFL